MRSTNPNAMSFSLALAIVFSFIQASTATVAERFADMISIVQARLTYKTLIND